MFITAKEEMDRIHHSLDELAAEGNAGGGMVRVRVNGRMEVLACVLSDEVLGMNDREMLEDLICAATNQVLRRVVPADVPELKQWRKVLKRHLQRVVHADVPEPAELVDSEEPRSMFKELGQMAGFLRQLPRIKEEMDRLQQRLGQLTAEGDAGGGMVRVRVNGRLEVLAC